MGQESDWCSEYGMSGDSWKAGPLCSGCTRTRCWRAKTLETSTLVKNTQWDLTPKEAVKLQERLRGKARIEDDFGEVQLVAGVDVAIGRGWKQGKCGIVVLALDCLEVVETKTCTRDVTFPYVPGLLAFREAPIFLDTYALLETEPDLLFFDGHGLAHPRRFGLACHAGVLIDKPSIGCAKSKLVGDYEEPGVEAGGRSALLSADGERMGDVLRTKAGVKPVFISPGHRVSFDTACRMATKCAAGYRIPQPTRLAHMLVSGTGINQVS